LLYSEANKDSIPTLASVSSHQQGISSEELKEAIPEVLASRRVHLHWIDRKAAGEDSWILSAKIEVDGQILLLHSRTQERQLMEDWGREDPRYHTNARLVALERILTDPANEDRLLSM
jgi:hypothetical protein